LTQYNFHFKDDGTHTTILVPNSQLVNASLITGDKSKINPLLYRGIALIADDKNPLRVVVMSAESTAYSFNPKNPVKEVKYFIDLNMQITIIILSILWLLANQLF
jgi:oligosaccharyltransferase complex subunit beta